MKYIHSNRVVGAVAAVLVATVAIACSTERAPSENVATQKSALTPDASPPFNTAAKETIDWPKLVSGLKQDNIFRIVYKANSNAKNRGDDGMWALDPGDQKLLAQFKADNDEVYKLFFLAGSKPLGTKESARVAELQARYAPARQELVEALMKTPELSPAGRQALLTAVTQINGSRAMQLTPPTL